MEEELPYGPWKKILAANWNGYPLQVYENTDRLLLMLLFEKKGDEVSGVLVLERRGYMIEGSIGGTSIAQRDMVVIEKRSKDGAFKYAIIDSTPGFVPYSAEDLANEVTKQYGELESIGRVLKKTVADFSGAKLIELKKATEREAEGLMGDPLLLLSLAGHGGGGVRETAGAKVIIGLTAGKEHYEIPLDKLRSVGIAGGSKEKRLHALHVAVEGALENNVPCLLFDTVNAFTGLGLPNRDSADYKGYGMEGAMGFPLKAYELGKGLFIDLELIESDMFLSAFKVEHSDVARAIKKVYDEKHGRISFLGDLVSELNALPESPDYPRFVTNKAIRVLETIQKLNPSLFAKNISDELSEPWKDGVGKVVHVGLAGQRPEIQQLVIYSLLKALLRPSLSGFTVMVAFEPDAGQLDAEAGKLLQMLYRQGKGFVLEAEHEIDLSRLADPQLMIEIIGSDAVLTDKEEKSKKRVTLRPAYSHCSEYAAVPMKKDEKKR
ncbi:MAG: hypothetical protein V1787_06210 [Candidatus Micrarchaeota archaeon]